MNIQDRRQRIRARIEAGGNVLGMRLEHLNAMDVLNLKKNDRVLVVSSEAGGNPEHPSCKSGSVSAIAPDAAFVKLDDDVAQRGWRLAANKIVHPENIRIL